MANVIEADWEIRFSQSRQRPYFYSNKTKQSIWDPPEGLTSEDIMKLPGSKYLHGAVSGEGLTGALTSQVEKVRASHLLIKHCESRKPSSWKEDKITRSKSEAIKILQTYETELNKISNPEQKLKRFKELSEKNSDCSSHANGGDLGNFRRGQMQKPFEDVSFNLNVGEMSSIVSTESGVHLIFRTE